jgi:hypothetical protein
MKCLNVEQATGDLHHAKTKRTADSEIGARENMKSFRPMTTVRGLALTSEILAPGAKAVDCNCQTQITFNVSLKILGVHSGWACCRPAPMYANA